MRVEEPPVRESVGARVSRSTASISTRIRAAVAVFLAVAGLGAAIASAALWTVWSRANAAVAEMRDEAIPLLQMVTATHATALGANRLATDSTLPQGTTRAELGHDVDRVNAGIDLLGRDGAGLDTERERARFRSGVAAWERVLPLLSHFDKPAVRLETLTIAVGLDIAANAFHDVHDIALLELEQLVDDAARQRDRALQLVLMAVAASAGIVLLTGRHLTRAIVPPTRRLQFAAGRIAAGDLDSPVPAEGPTELADVAHSFNAMAEQLRLREGDLLYRALHDPLTGLGNRALLHERLDRAVTRLRRHPAESTALLIVDLDGFKKVNDSLGHSCGDAALQIIAGRIQSCLRDGDTLSRLGGDEFAIVVEDSNDHANLIGQRIREAVGDPLVLAGRSVTLTASVGIATARSASASVEELLRNADLAMYAAKGRGGNSVERFVRVMHQRATEHLELEASLRAAHERNEFEVHYQPAVDLHTGAIRGVEALVRWRHPRLGLLLPGRFIDLAEETGLIVDLGLYILATATTDVRRWIDTCPSLTDFTLAVNVSTRQVREPDFADRVIETIRASQLTPDRLVLEITETALLSHLQEAREKFSQLRELGVRIALDDFGTGYTSLQYLRDLPVDILKIDRGFVDGVAHRPDLQVLVRTIVSLAEGLHLDVVGEGVEHDEDAEMLKSLGCGTAQGFALHRPAPAEDIRRLLCGAESCFSTKIGLP